MSKVLYSIILNDEVVNKVDKLASLNGLSRSNMIEKILADYVGFETPEIRASSIFEEIERLITNYGSMRFLDQPSQYMASIMGALDYRYNPAIKYSVELFPQSDYLGQLKVSLRTTNENLLKYMKEFYKYYSFLEKNYYNPEARFLSDSQRFVRLFNIPNGDVSTTDLAECISGYVTDFDTLLGVYFNNLTVSENRLIDILTSNYKKLKEGVLVI